MHVTKNIATLLPNPTESCRSSHQVFEQTPSVDFGMFSVAFQIHVKRWNSHIPYYTLTELIMSGLHAAVHEKIL